MVLCVTAMLVVTSGMIVRSMSRLIAPGRRIIGGVEVRSSTVDSSPTGVFPPSTTISIQLLRSSSTCCADVGLGCPNKFALGAAIGSPTLLSNARATG